MHYRRWCIRGERQRDKQRFILRGIWAAFKRFTVHRIDFFSLVSIHSFLSVLNAFVLRFPTVTICKMIYEHGKRFVAIADAAATNQPRCQASMEFRVCGMNFWKEKEKLFHRSLCPGGKWDSICTQRKYCCEMCRKWMYWKWALDTVHAEQFHRIIWHSTKAMLIRHTCRLRELFTLLDFICKRTPKRLFFFREKKIYFTIYGHRSELGLSCLFKHFKNEF